VLKLTKIVPKFHVGCTRLAYKFGQNSDYIKNTIKKKLFVPICIL